MKPKPPDFFLVCTEMRSVFETRACYIEQQIKLNDKEGYLLCKVSPPIDIPNIIYNLDTVVFAPRHAGINLISINEWPMYVYVCSIVDKKALIDNCLSARDLRNIFWGTLHKTYQDANTATMRHAEQISDGK